MHEPVCQDVAVVGGPELSDPNDCLCYALDLGELVLIDAGLGPGFAAIVENLLDFGHPLEELYTLVLTHAHADHIGGAPLAVAASGCTVVAHALDAPAIESGDPRRTAADWYRMRLEPLRVDRKVAFEREVLRFSGGILELIHIPGHTPGSLAAWLPESRVLFGQDIHGPFHPAFGSDLCEWRGSMERLLALEAEILCEGHFGVFRGRAQVRRFIEEHLRRHGG